MRLKSKTKIKLEIPIPVYDLEAEKNSNFVLAGGCIVHNSKDLLDAEVNSIYSISLNTAYFSQTSNKYQEIMQKKVLEQLKTPQDEIRDFLKSRRF